MSKQPTPSPKPTDPWETLDLLDPTAQELELLARKHDVPDLLDRYVTERLRRLHAALRRCGLVE